MATTTIRVEDDLHARLREIAREEHRPMGEVLREAIDRYEREKFWDAVDASVERLRANSGAWKNYRDEIRLLEGGSMDGLENEPPYYTPEEIEALLADETDPADR